VILRVFIADIKLVSKRTKRRRTQRKVDAFFRKLQENQSDVNICPEHDSTYEASLDCDQHLGNAQSTLHFDQQESNEFAARISEASDEDAAAEIIESDARCPPFYQSLPAAADNSIADEQFPIDQRDVYDDQDEMSDPEDSDESDTLSDNPDDVPSLSEQLAAWYLSFEHCVSREALKALLTVLRGFDLEVPKDPRTLVKTPRKYKILHVAGGKYHHFGLVESVCNCIKQLPVDFIAPSELSLFVNVDGLPLFKSSGMQLWPIMGKLDGFPTGPFLIGLWAGSKKPTDADAFLEDFVNDVQAVKDGGFCFNGRRYQISLDGFICDAPARQYLKKVKPHTGFSSCERCTSEGDSVNSCIVFDEMGTLRTDESFKNQSDPVHHVGISPLVRIGVDCVLQFILDYMHLVCLGVCRRMVFAWMHQYRRHFATRISARVMNAISERLTHLAENKHVPREFARKPRSLFEYKRWKATEWRQFLLYTGPVVLLGLINEPVYENFLRLSVAMTILLDPKLAKAHADYAEKLMQQFVRDYRSVYGVDMVVYNVHCLLHIAQDARKFGHLDNVSAFPFESYLGRLKRKVKRPFDPLPQIVRRTYERQSHSRPMASASSSLGMKELHRSGPLPDDLYDAHQFLHYDGANFRVSCVSGDNCFELNSHII
jgi:hypothetical protein